MIVAVRVCPSAPILNKRMLNPKDELEIEFLKICQLIGQATDPKKLRKYFVTANALMARIDRLSLEPPECA